MTSFPQEGQVDFDPETVDEAVPGSAPDADEPTGQPVDPAQQEALDTADEEARAAELTADLQRVQAEFLNYKRRVDRDRDLVKQNATFSVLSALLPVLDDVDRAREHGELNGGFKAVAEALERVVTSQGLEKFGAPGEPFDPRIHEALMHGLSTEVDTTTCDKVVQAGYRIGERVVRPALVTVVDPDPSGDTGTQSPGPDAASEAGGGSPGEEEG